MVILDARRVRARPAADSDPVRRHGLGCGAWTGRVVLGASRSARRVDSRPPRDRFVLLARRMLTGMAQGDRPVLAAPAHVGRGAGVSLSWDERTATPYRLATASFCSLGGC